MSQTRLCKHDPRNRCVTCSSRVGLIDIFILHIYQNGKYFIIESFLSKTNIFYSNVSQHNGKTCMSKSGSNPIISQFLGGVNSPLFSLLSPLYISENTISSQLSSFCIYTCLEHNHDKFKNCNFGIFDKIDVLQHNLAGAQSYYVQSTS